MKRLFFEKFVWQLGNTCNITAALWFLRRFLKKWIWNTRYYYFSYKPTKKGKRFLIWKCHVTMYKKGANLLIWRSHVTITKRDTYISNKIQLKIILWLSFTKNKSLLLATSTFSRSPIAYNTTASLDKLTCTDYMDFANVKTDSDNFSGPKTIPTTWM